MDLPHPVNNRGKWKLTHSIGSLDLDFLKSFLIFLNLRNARNVTGITYFDALYFQYC